MWEYFSPNLKKGKGKKRKRKEEEKESGNIIVYIFNTTGVGLLVFFDDKPTTFRNKNIL